MAKKIKQIEMKMPRQPRKTTVKKPKEKMSEKIIKKTKRIMYLDEFKWDFL